jgi:hypothetical protein
VSEVPSAETEVAPPARADDDERDDSATPRPTSGPDAVFADPDWLSTLPTPMVTAPPAGTDVAEAELAAAVAAFAFLINSRRVVAEPTKKSRTLTSRGR